MSSTRLLNIKEVCERTSLSKSSVYRYMLLGAFPAAVPVGIQRAAWVEAEVEDWIQRRVSQREKAAV
jgi:prophage regulatory protein